MKRRARLTPISWLDTYISSNNSALSEKASLYGGNAFQGTQTTDGSVGIGTGGSAPATRLHVLGTHSVDMLRLDAGITHGLNFGAVNGGAYPWYIQARNHINPAVKYPVIINSEGGNVGISTADPQAPLHVGGPILPGAYTIATTPAAAAAGARIVITDSTPPYRLARWNGSAWLYDDTGGAV